jgi:hypothetical protein
MKFTYSSGQRPLEGYTIKRGIGHGGFGEVFFALSDGGKEVALKVIRNNLDVELRGMSQCLNFKHPNLVSLYDIREDAQGNHWVIMEYVAGESLSTILTRHPEGIAPELAQQWFLGLAAAVSYLHDHGIVHRDLKPGNIFIENGTVKVGDYGLCKCVSGSQRTAQTQSVGTVHYMAPEISTGNYNKQIDVYAAGVILYEMLSGRVPFEGESVGEILMKHLTTPADLTKVPRVWAQVLGRALAKNPAHRHRSMNELARDVAAVGTVDMPVPKPQKPLYVAKPIPTPPPIIPQVQPVTIPPRTRVAELCTSLVLSTLLAGLFTMLWAALLQTNDITVIGRYFFLGLASCWALLIPAQLWTRRTSESLSRRAGLMCLGLLVGMLALWLEGYDVAMLLGPTPAVESVAQAQGPRAAPGVNVVNGSHSTSSAPSPVVGRNTVWSSLLRTQNSLPIVACYLSYFGLGFFGLRWWQLADRRRRHRFSLYTVIAAAVLGLILLVLFWPVPPAACAPSGNNVLGLILLVLFWPGPEPAIGVVTLVMAAIVVQLVSPWQRPVEPRPRKLRLPQA